MGAASGRWSVLVALVLVALGCSEAASDDDGEGGGGSSTTTSDGAGGSATPATTGATGATTSTGAGGALQGLVINEISADGDDWIEILNAGSAEIDLTGLRIADAEEPGVPKVDEAVAIPDGTTLPAGAYLFVLADQDPAAEGLQDVCAPGPAPCLQAGWGLSKDGDEVFLLGEGDAIVATAAFVAGSAPEGQAWGRLPDGTGDFAATAPTPGGPNAAP
jgi:hypothetical protein